MSNQRFDNVIFDLGGVLVDWDPKYLYTKVFEGDTNQMNWFLDNVCTNEWNMEQDAGRDLKEATNLLLNKFPEYESAIRAFYDRWEEMLKGEIKETVRILKNIKHLNRYKLYSLTNWSAQTFPVAVRRFDFLNLFEGIVVSGDEKTRKPFQKIYDILLDKYELDPQRSVFIDDNLDNVNAANACGIHGIHFTSPEKLKIQLKNLKII